MTWFKVDDKLHSHNKTRKVLADDPAALALWTVAGSWSSDNLTDGFVPDHQLPWLLPTRADELAQILVAARLWRRVRGGYQFHEWSTDSDGTKRNPTRSEVEEERRKKVEAGRKGGLASGQKRSSVTNGRPGRDLSSTLKNKRSTDEHPSGNPPKKSGRTPRTSAEDIDTSTATSENDRSTSEARASASATAPAEPDAERLVEPPTRPDPTNKNSGTGSRHSYGGSTRDADDPPINAPYPAGPPGATEKILTSWQALLTKPPQAWVVNEVGRRVHDALADRQDPSDVWEAVRLWQLKINEGRDLGPGALPAFIHQIAQRQPTTDLALTNNPTTLIRPDPRPSRRNAAVAQGLAVAEALERRHHDAG